MLSVVIPVFNEEKMIEGNLKKVIKFLDGYEKDYEILVIDDGSVDSTPKKLKKLSISYNRVRILKHKKNMGIGAAIRTGLKNSNGDIIITMDSDLTYSPKDIRVLIRYMKEKNADIVIGTPYIKGGDTSGMPFVRRVLSRGINLMDQIIFRLNFTTPTSFFRAWKKKTAKNIKIKSDRFESVAESSIKAYRQGYKVVEAPVKYRLVGGRESRLKILPTIKKHLEMDMKLLLRGDLD